MSMSTANDELFFGFREAIHREVIAFESIDDPFFVYFAEQFVVDRPDSRTVAGRVCLHTNGDPFRERAYGD